MDAGEITYLQQLTLYGTAPPLSSDEGEEQGEEQGPPAGSRDGDTTETMKDEQVR